MQDFLQYVSRRRVRKHNLPQFIPAELALGVDEFWAKGLTDLGECRLAGSNDIAGHTVRINYRYALFA
jgi:hypothetical protein